jgi:predicted ATPase
VVDKPEEALQGWLSHLQTAEFLYEQPAFPEVEYIFKHALTQEVAYTSVLQERRKAVHERTAQAIEALYQSRLEDYYGELAHHYSRSGNTLKAIEYLHRAGQQAVQRSALAEAVTHFTTALEFLQTLADTSERAQQELTLQLALVTPLALTKGPTAPEVGAVHTRALELCRQVGETPQLVPALWGARRFSLFRAELQTARELAERLLPLAQRAQDSAFLPEAHFGLGSVLHSMGELVSARAHCEQALALYDPGQRRSAIAFGGVDLGVFSLVHLANILWLLGYPDQAQKRNRQALTLAQEIDHPSSAALVGFMNTILHRFLYGAQAVQQQAETLIALSNERGFPLLSAGAIARRGWALAMQGQEEEGIPQIHQGMAADRAAGTELFRPYHLALLAEAYGKAGQIEEGLAALAEALDLVDKTGERMYEAELYRLTGELTLQQLSVASSQLSVTNPQSPTPNPQTEAEACFLKAVDVAQKQQAKSLELRTVTSLARLWQQQSKKIEARQMLIDVYNWFTEGFDTQDLKDAKALLEELARPNSVE